MIAPISSPSLSIGTLRSVRAPASLACAALRHRARVCRFLPACRRSWTDLLWPQYASSGMPRRGRASTGCASAGTRQGARHALNAQRSRNAVAIVRAARRTWPRRCVSRSPAWPGRPAPRSPGELLMTFSTSASRPAAPAPPRARAERGESSSPAVAARAPRGAPRRWCRALRLACGFCAPAPSLLGLRLDLDRQRERRTPSPCRAPNSTQSLPPCISTMRREIDRPRPVPPFFLVAELSACWNSSKILP